MELNIPQDFKAGRLEIPNFSTLPLPNGRNWLLAIAIDKYEPEIGALNNCVRDVQAFIDVVTKDYNFEHQYIIPLFDENATAEGIESALRRMLHEVEPKDNLIIYYSGHGGYDKELKLGYWIPVDAKNRTKRFYNNLITQFLDQIPSLHTLLLCDSCFSGSIIIEESTKDISQRYYNEPSRWAITSGAIELVSDGRDNSPFAKALLRVLQRKNRDVDVLTLGTFIMEEVAATEKQKPLFAPMRVNGHQGGVFVFFQKHNEHREWEIAQNENTVRAYTIYCNKYPKGIYYEAAKSKIRRLEEDNAWQKALKINLVFAFQDYLEIFPEGIYASEAKTKMDKLLNNEISYKHDIEKIAAKYYEKLAEQKYSDNKMVLIKGGTFQMGDTLGDGTQDEHPVHPVTVRDFYLSKHPVTFEEYDKFCKETNKDLPDGRDWGRGLIPVVDITWYDAIDFCNWLSFQEGYEEVYKIDKDSNSLTNTNAVDFGDKKWTVICNWQANGYRLPSEAEWEFAARERGNLTRFGNGNDIAEPLAINFNCKKIFREAYSMFCEENNFKNQPIEVGKLEPNSLGLYEMSGNVQEWCWDWHSSDYTYQSKYNQDTYGITNGSHRVIRGGSWWDKPINCRACSRGRLLPYYRLTYVGFRLAQTVK